MLDRKYALALIEIQQISIWEPVKHFGQCIFDRSASGFSVLGAIDGPHGFDNCVHNLICRTAGQDRVIERSPVGSASTRRECTKKAAGRLRSSPKSSNCGCASAVASLEI